jgi:uracil-DNA glycosylase family 4
VFDVGTDGDSDVSEMLCRRLEEKIGQCRKCAEILSGKCVDPTKGNDRVEPRPIVSRIASQTIMLVGQAPGLTEYRRAKAFQGPAGRQIRNILAGVGISHGRFGELVYPTAIVRCFPGSKRTKRGRGDEIPAPRMVENCLPFLRQVREILKPKIIITLGAFPLKAYLNLRNRKLRSITLGEHVGTSDFWDGAIVIFLPHTSGNSLWLNKTENRARLETAKYILRKALIDCHLINANPIAFQGG